MKTVKFKDIHEKVQGFLNRVFDANFPSSYKLDLDWLHALPFWSRATDEERLAYAELRYPKGTKIERLIPDYETYICFGEPRLAIYNYQNNWIFDGDGIGIYDPDKNKWAEIIEEPFNLTDTGAFSSEPEFKAGDEVDHKFVNSEWLSEGLRFTGGVTSQGLYICEDKHGSIKQCEQIRKSDPDKHLREIAKEIAMSFPTLIYCEETHFHEQSVEQMLIEALKKGKSL